MSLPLKIYKAWEVKIYEPSKKTVNINADLYYKQELQTRFPMGLETLASEKNKTQK